MKVAQQCVSLFNLIQRFECAGGEGGGGRYYNVKTNKGNQVW